MAAGTIHAALLDVFDGRYPGRGMRLVPNGVAGGPPRIEFPAASADVGELVVEDDGFEATVWVGNLAHGHFSRYDQSLTDQEKAEDIARGVMEFIDALFADRVLLWRGERGAGGWRVLDEPVTQAPSSAGRWFLWSRALD